MTRRVEPHAVSTSAERELVAILGDPACPWEDRRGSDPAGRGWRRVQVDRLLAFAFLRGAELRGLEERLDLTVAALGGQREPLPRGSELPYYRLPAASARTDSTVSASSRRLSSR